MRSVLDLYGRVPQLMRAAPAIALLVFAAEMLQHVVEIRLGMYAGGTLDRDAEATRLIFGAVKVIAIFLAILFALRWWRFGGDARRAARPSLAMLKGLAIVMLIQIGGEVLLVGMALAIGTAFAPLPAQAQAALIIGPISLWLFLATLLYPWYVGLLTEDPMMTLRRSVTGMWGRLWACFALFLAAFLPAMAVHYALGYAAIGRPEPLVWALMILDSAVVAVLALLLASAYYSLYQQAGRRAPA